MVLFRVFLFLLLSFSALSGQEPVPFVNPHPISASHFNPVMDGGIDRLEIAYKHSSYYEEDRIRYKPQLS